MCFLIYCSPALLITSDLLADPLIWSRQLAYWITLLTLATMI
jgi:hypothetical protein